MERAKKKKKKKKKKNEMSKKVHYTIMKQVLKHETVLLNFQMILRQRYLMLNKTIHGERCQIWTLKQMLQRLPITIMQVKAGNTVNKTFFLSSKWNY